MIDISLYEMLYWMQEHTVGQRTGQMIMNALHEVSPELAARVPEEVDPFYEDSKVRAFWEWFYEEIGE